MRTGGLLVKEARAVRAIGITPLRASLARIEHGQTNQKLTIRAHGYNKKKNAPAAKTLRILSAHFDIAQALPKSSSNRSISSSPK